MSTRMASATSRSGVSSSVRSATAKGSSSASMYSRPMRLTTRTRAPFRGSTMAAPAAGGAGPGRAQGGAAAGRAGREIRRGHEPRLALDEDERLALVPGMVVERHGVGPGHQDLVADRLGDAEAAGGVLAVDHDAIEPPALAQRRQPRRDGAAPGPSDDIAEEEEAHPSRLARLAPQDEEEPG